MSRTTQDSSPQALTAPTISLQGIGKSYAGVSVLRHVTFDIRPGEIHGLLGENGAGKSTLLNILGGSVAQDEGEIQFDGETVRLASPRESISRGVSLITQELAIVPRQTVLENVFLGRWSNLLGVVNPAADRRAFLKLRDELGFDLDPDAIVGFLSVGKAQQVEIMKALARGSRVLCLDEPTASLGESDTEQLLAVLRRLASQGTTIVIVSHFLEEVLGLADRITVLRDGAQITTESSSTHSPGSIVRLMVGREIKNLSQTPEPVAPDSPIVLRTEGLTTDKVSDVSLEVHRGEIVGLAGLVGSGRSELLRAIFGADSIQSGSLELSGKTIRQRSIRASIRRGVALIPESRKTDGLVLGRTSQENVSLPTLGLRQRLGFIDTTAERRDIGRVLALVDVRGNVQRIPAGALSGGNQQKLLFAKWLVDPPQVLLVDEPTRGVDVAAKANIHRLLIELAAAGTAMIVASSELEEVLSLSHRVLVLRHGRIVKTFTSPADRHDVMSAAFHQETKKS